jgi:hypothetical protein
MPKHEPVRRRRPPTRQPRRTILIVVGANRTEADYLKGMREHFKAATVSMRIVAKPGAPDQLVEYARDSCGRDRYDEVWCVTDVDHYEREGGKVTTALSLAAQTDIQIAVSNPCFEIWLLLHREACTSPCENCDVVLRKLRKRLPAYDKSRLRFEDYAEGLSEAIVRAESLEPSGRDHSRNPSTGVWRLVKAILEQQ